MESTSIGQSMNQLPLMLIGLGVFLIAVGALWYFGGKILPFGKLPGDLAYEGKNFKAYFPLGTSIVISIILSLLFWLFSYFRR